MGRALHSVYALSRGKKRSFLSIYDKRRPLQRSAVENRAAFGIHSACAEGVRRTDTPPCWVMKGIAQVTAEHRVHCEKASPA